MNSAQASGVDVSTGSASETCTSTTSPVDVVIGPPRQVIAARASRAGRRACPGAESITRAATGAADPEPPDGTAAAASAPRSTAPARTTAVSRRAGSSTTAFIAVGD